MTLVLLAPSKKLTNAWTIIVLYTYNTIIIRCCVISERVEYTHTRIYMEKLKNHLRLCYNVRLRNELTDKSVAVTCNVCNAVDINPERVYDRLGVVLSKWKMPVQTNKILKKTFYKHLTRNKHNIYLCFAWMTCFSYF